MDSDTYDVLVAMRDYLAKQREHRAQGSGFNQDGFQAVYIAVNKLGYLDKELPERRSVTTEGK